MDNVLIAGAVSGMGACAVEQGPLEASSPAQGTTIALLYGPAAGIVFRLASCNGRGTTEE